MARILLAASSLYGHVRPLAQIGAAFRAAGHDATLLTGQSFRRIADRSDVRLISPAADNDHPAPSSSRRRLRSPAPWVRGRNAILDFFVRPLVAQAVALDAALDRGVNGNGFDAVVADVSFLGVQPLLVSTSSGDRPPVIGISVTPIIARSLDCPPFGTALPPWQGPMGRRRNRQVDWLLQHGPMRVVQRRIDAAVAAWGVRPGDVSFFDAITRFDRVFQLGLRELEYPRSELSSLVEFVGALPTICSCERHPPLALEGGKPIVHVTQGTIDNADHSRLLVPALRALASRGYPVIASTGGVCGASLRAAFGGRPGVQITEFVCYDWLLPQLDLMITNGGYGGVQLAARHGIPLLVAGDTEDKAEVGARVRWSGAGIDLRTGRPSPGRIGKAIDTLLADERYARRTAELAASAQHMGNPLDRIVGGVTELIRS